MSEAVATAPTSRIERIKTLAAVIAAVAGALTGLWGVYEKVRGEARRDTAASYNTLAPQVNQLGEALKQLQQENQQLRGIVATQQGKPRIGVVPRKSERPAAASSTAGAGSVGAPGASSTTAPVVAAPAATPPAGAPPAPAAGAPPEVTPTASAPAASAPAANPPAEESGDAVDGLLRTVGRTRAAIESLRKVPEDFGHMLEKKDNPPPPAPALERPPAP